MLHYLPTRRSAARRAAGPAGNENIVVPTLAYYSRIMIKYIPSSSSCPPGTGPSRRRFLQLNFNCLPIPPARDTHLVVVLFRKERCSRVSGIVDERRSQASSISLKLTLTNERAVRITFTSRRDLRLAKIILVRGRSASCR